MPMKRLIYSPKVYVFIRSRTQNKTYDVSDYVVSGSVKRNINAPSKAEFVLKNRFFRFSANRQEPLFLPMDGVTIWMQRIAGRPIQVFTGYLDQVPYFQLYPADAPFTATCTLKRLGLVYFDPGVTATMKFFSDRNWILAPDGQAVDFNAQGQSLNSTGGNTMDGIGDLLRDFIEVIGGWKKNTIIVSDVPHDLPKRAAKLYDELESDLQIQRDALEGFLKSLITLKANHAESVGAPAVDKVKKVMAEGTKKNVDNWFLVMAALVLSGLKPEYAQEDTTATNPGYGLYALQSISPPEIGGSAPTGDATSGSTPAPTGTADDIEGYKLSGNGANTIFTIPNSVDAFIKRIKRNAPNTNFRLNFRTQPYEKTAELIAKGSNRNEFKAQIQAAVETNADLVQQYLGAAGGTTHDPSVVSSERPFGYWQIDTASMDWNVTWDKVRERMGLPATTQPESTGTVPVTPATPTPQGPGAAEVQANSYTSAERNVLNTDNYKKLSASGPNGYNRAAAFAYVGLQAGYDLVPLQISDTNGETLLVMVEREGATTTAALLGFYAWASTQTTNRGKVEVWYRNFDPGNITRKYSVNGRQIGAESGTPDIGIRGVPTEASTELMPPSFKPNRVVPRYVVIRMTDNSNPIDPPYYDGHPLFSNTATATQTQDDQTTFKFSDLLKVSFSAAFTSRFSFPADFVTSNVLSGDRSLMNDIPVLEGVDKICKASMRSYMSMPSGEFLAFFPDYFGSYERDPYWKIYDTEIINMGINLSDENLVTHAFVTGATTMTGEISFINKALSLGVVSVEQVFNSDNFIGSAKWYNGDTQPGVENQAAIANFLGIYGMRPKSIENPLIRSQVVEFLYAWQMFMYYWAAQFATRCEFTFMPELLAGGRVAFPNHALECYVEQVTHSWSYKDGFETSAVLMAPAAAGQNKKRWPGMALTYAVPGGFATAVSGGGS